MLSDALGGREEWEKVKKGEKGISATCGSGMTAAVIWLAVKVAGREAEVGVYDEVSLSLQSSPKERRADVPLTCRAGLDTPAGPRARWRRPSDVI